MKKLLVICFSSVLLAVGCQKGKPVMVERMAFDPAVIELFPGEDQEVNLQCYPSNATNLDDIVIRVVNPSVAQFENGKLVAKSSGSTMLKATCGTVSTTAPVMVYAGWFSKGGTRYGVGKASGHIFMESEPTPQSLDLTLTCQQGQDTQSFWLLIKYDLLGKTIDFMQDMQESMVSVQKNNNEDGYCVAYFSEELGRPVIVTAEWGDTDAVLTKGLLTVNQTDTGYKVLADFALSNGYTFAADWEGPVTMVTE